MKSSPAAASIATMGWQAKSSSPRSTGRSGRSRSPCRPCQRLTALRSQSCFSAPSCGAMKSGNSGATLAWPGAAAQPAEGLAQGRLGEQVLHALETGSQQRRIGQIEHVADVIVGGDFRDPEQGLAVRPPLAFLKGALERQKRRALHEKQGEGRQTEIRHRDIAAPPLPGVRKSRADRAQTSQKGWQKFHPNGESFLR